MAYWVHREIGTFPWIDACEYEPSAPSPFGAAGYLFLCVEFKGVLLLFSSPEQLICFIEVLSKKPLMTTRALSSSRGTDIGPNSHWFSRLPKSLKSPRSRESLIKNLKKIPLQVFNSVSA